MASDQSYYDAPPRPTSAFTWLALLVAFGVAGGSFWLSAGVHLEPHKAKFDEYNIPLMKLVPCPLCYYQRTFALAAFGVLFLGLLTGAGRKISLALLTTPLAVAGVAIAGFHVYLVQQGQLECPNGIADYGTVPMQSLVGFGGLTLLLVIDMFVHREEIGGAEAGMFASLLVGAVLTAGCLYSAPKLPDPPTKKWDSPLIKCRVPYREPEKKEPDA